MYARHLTRRILKALSTAPVVLLQGARQSGKSTLVRSIIGKQRSRQYITLDNADYLASATLTPQTFIKSLKLPVAIDEVQLAPEIFRSIKLAIDENRRAGMFLLTGSANVMVLPRLSESLVGRLQIVTLWPLSQGEIENVEESFVTKVFRRELKTVKIGHPENSLKLVARVVRGGFPEAVQLRTAESRSDWFNSYVSTVLQRDVRELAHIDRLTAVPNLLKLIATRIGDLLNVSDLGSAAAIPHSTLSRYLAVLENTYLIYFLKPWSVRESARLTRSKKIYLSDTGLAAHLLKMPENSHTSAMPGWGHLLENFVLLELIKQTGWSEPGVELFHFRTQKGVEVDFVLENRAGQIVGIEVKAGPAVRQADLRGLDFLEQIAGKKFVCGVVLHTGDSAYPLASNKWAIPISCLWKELQPS